MSNTNTLYSIQKNVENLILGCTECLFFNEKTIAMAGSTSERTCSVSTCPSMKNSASIFMDAFLLTILRQKQSLSLIKKVFIGGKFVQLVKSEELKLMIQDGIAYLPDLQELEIVLPFVNYKLTSISGTTLGILLQRQKTIRSIVIWPYITLNDNTEIDILSRSLENHTSLETVAFMNLLLVRNNNKKHIQQQQDTLGSGIEIINRPADCHGTFMSASMEDEVLDPLFRSLASIPNLTNVQLAAGVNCLSPPRQKNHDDGYLTTIQDYSVIQDYSNSVCLLLQHPKLKNLSLRNLGLTDEFCIYMMETLAKHKHTSLQSIDIRFNHFITITGYQAIYDLLVVNDSNYILQYIDSDEEISTNEKQKQEIDFVLRINRAGRHKLLHPSNNNQLQQQDIIQILVNAENDIDVLYYLIRCNPSVFC